MTVPPDDPAHPQVRQAFWAAFGLIAWTAFFAALVIAYLIAFNRHVHTCQEAAAWGLSISLAAAMLSLTLTLRRIGAGSRTPPGRSPTSGAVAAVGCLLIAGSVAVIWVAMDLTLAGQPAGPWSLVLPAVASVIVVPATGGVSLGRHGEPSAGAIALVGTAVPEASDELVPGVASQPAAGPAGATIAKPRPAVLLARDWPSLLEQPCPAVALESGFWRAAVHALAGQRTEQGGVALVSRAQDVLLVLGAVFPSQVSASSTRCEFPTIEVDRVRRALDQVADDIGIAAGEIRMTWVHTHPRLGVFLSGTDHNTSHYWRQLDPQFTPIVIDASRDLLNEQIGVFDSGERQMLPMRVADGLVDERALSRLRESLLTTYLADGEAEPLILLSESRGD